MEEEQKIDYSKILLKDPLYSKYILSEWNFDEIIAILYYTKALQIPYKIKTLDSFCPICNKETTFNSKETYSESFENALVRAGYVSNGNGTIARLIKELQNLGTFIRVFQCPRSESDPSHDHVFLFKIIDSNLIKIGQNPSIADLSKKEIVKYRILKDDIYQEFNRAIGLASHGIGVGSFVYLRRIIENHIILPKINQLILDGKIKQEIILKLDFKEKINIVKDLIPEFLVRNIKIYSILSKGIHELDENECKEIFPVLRTSIEMILDEEIEKQEKNKKNKVIEKLLNDLN